MIRRKPDLAQKLQQALRLDRAVRLVWKSAPGWTAVSLALVVVQGLLPLASLYLMKQIVDMAAVAVSVLDRAAAFRQVLFWILLAAGVGVLSALAQSLSDLVGQVQSIVVTDDIADILHAQSVTVDLEYYEDHRYYDTLHRAQQEAPYRPTRIVNGLIQLGQNSLSLVGATAILFSFNWLLGLLLVGAAVPGALVRVLHARKIYGFEQKQAQAERKAWYYHWMMTNSSHAKEIRLFNLGSLFQRRFLELRQQLREGRLALSQRRALADLLTQTVATAAIFGTFAFVCYQAILGAVTVGGLVMYYQGFQLLLRSVQAILRGLTGLYEDNLFLSNFYQFLDLTPKIQVPACPHPVPTKVREGVVFQGVHFTYPSRSHEVLQEISLTLAPGEVIALVGENGSGKTTLIKLLCRLYDPTAGKIVLDGIDLRQLDPVHWRRQISVVFQDYIQYSLTAWENIWLGNVELEPKRELIERAARLSGADSVIRSLPHGYDTVLGYQFRDGQELSTGEWQKMALARAFMRDARIIVLDEPTSSLDPLAEAELFEQFRKLVKGRSAILISHRFSTVRMADTIYVLEQGRIIEGGSHEQLLQQGGKYARLFEIQAQNYV